MLYMFVGGDVEKRDDGRSFWGPCEGVKRVFSNLMSRTRGNGKVFDMDRKGGSVVYGYRWLDGWFGENR
jgi:hypothetical protein